MEKNYLMAIFFLSYQLCDNSSTVFSNSLNCIGGKFHGHKSIKFLNPDSLFLEIGEESSFGMVVSVGNAAAVLRFYSGN
jgi:hypothetical protein